MIPEKTPFFITAENKALIHSIMAGKDRHPVNILIKGKHGLGKSELARQLAATYDMNYVPIPINLLQESGQLMGHDEFVDNQTRFVESNFVRAVRGTEQPVVTGADGLAALALAFRVLEAVGAPATLQGA